MKAPETAEKLRSYIWAAMEIIDKHKDRPGLVEEGKERIETYQAAEEAVKKQIPKEPYDDTCPERTLHKCPTCKYIFVTEYPDGSLCAGSKSKHCPECGQAMQW